MSRVRRTIREHDLARPGTRVIVGLSGGPDSVALVDVIARLAAAGDLVFGGIAHFNHQLRATAERDEVFCRDLAGALRLPIAVGRADVGAMARAERRSVEGVAHDARYRFFEDAREQLDGDVVALGHTRDDQAETFLLRLVRGAGARGLAAMYPRHGFIVRPLIDCRRAELVDWLNERSIRFLVDETNADVSIPRNRVRAELLPLIAARFNPGAVDALADAAEIARGEWQWLEHEADELLRDSGIVGDGRIELDAAQLAGMPVALRRLVVWRALARLTDRVVTFAHVADVLELRDGGHLDVPGQSVDRLGNRLVLTDSGHAEAVRRPPRGVVSNLFEYSLSIPGEVVVPEAGVAVAAIEGGGRPVPDFEPGEAVVRRDLCGGRLTVRNRRPGDRIRPVGLGGRKKLQDLFVDRKISRGDRDRIPLVTDETGRILCVAGFGIAEEFRVTDPAQPMLILRFKVLGGPA